MSGLWSFRPSKSGVPSSSSLMGIGDAYYTRDQLGLTDVLGDYDEGSAEWDVEPSNWIDTLRETYEGSSVSEVRDALDELQNQSYPLSVHDMIEQNGAHNSYFPAANLSATPLMTSEEPKMYPLPLQPSRATATLPLAPLSHNVIEKRVSVKAGRSVTAADVASQATHLRHMATIDIRMIAPKEIPRMKSAIVVSKSALPFVAPTLSLPAKPTITIKTSVMAPPRFEPAPSSHSLRSSHHRSMSQKKAFEASAIAPSSLVPSRARAAALEATKAQREYSVACNTMADSFRTRSLLALVVRCWSARWQQRVELMRSLQLIKLRGHFTVWREYPVKVKQRSAAAQSLAPLAQLFTLKNLFFPWMFWAYQRLLDKRRGKLLYIKKIFLTMKRKSNAIKTSREETSLMTAHGNERIADQFYIHLLKRTVLRVLKSSSESSRRIRYRQLLLEKARAVLGVE